MSKLYITFSLLFVFVSVKSQRFDWVSFTPLSSGSSGSGNISVVHDDENNIYTVSVFNDPIIIGEDTLTHVGNFNRPDILITKWNQNGQPIAYRHFANWSTNGNPDPQRLLYDEDNQEIILAINSYYFGMQVTLIGNQSSADTLLSLSQGALIRFNKDLDFISEVNIPGGNSYVTPGVVKNGFVYAAQGYTNTISKTDRDGNVIWSITPTGAGYNIQDIELTNQDTLFVIGYYTGSIFGDVTPLDLGGVSVSPPTAGNSTHTIIFKLDTAGNVLQGSYFAESTSYLNPVRLSSDPSGNLVVASGYAIGGQAIGNDTLSDPTGGSDAFVVKLNSALIPQWVTELHHTGGNMEIQDVVVNDSGKISAIGLYGSNANFGGFQLETAGFGSGFLVMLENSNGNVQYATNFGSLSAGTGRPHSVSRNNDTYYIGGLSFGTGEIGARYGCYTHTQAAAFLTVFTDSLFLPPSVQLTYEPPSLVATSNQAGGTYQWFLDGIEIDSEISNNIPVSTNGIYSVIFNQFGCAATDTLEILTVGINETNKDFFIYPNPASEFIHVNSVNKNSDYLLFNSSGQLVMKGKLNNNAIINTTSLTSGIYFIHFPDQGISSRVNIIN
ncbi:MAG: T9SS type A sorting domain-containing protein [Bacteroidia bacterium]